MKKNVIIVCLLLVCLLLFVSCQKEEVADLDNESPLESQQVDNDASKLDKEGYNLEKALEKAKSYTSFRQLMDLSMTMSMDNQEEDNFLLQMLSAMSEMAVGTDFSIENYSVENFANMKMAGKIDVSFAGTAQTFEMYMQEGLAYTYNDAMQLVYEKVEKEEMEESLQYMGIEQYLFDTISFEEGHVFETTLTIEDEAIDVMAYQATIDTKELFELMSDNKMLEAATNPDMGVGSFENATYGESTYVIYVTETNDLAGIDTSLEILPDGEYYVKGVNKVSINVTIRLMGQNDTTVILPDLTKAIENNE